MLRFHITNQIQEQGGLEQNKKLSDIRGPYSIKQHGHNKTKISSRLNTDSFQSSKWFQY